MLRIWKTFFNSDSQLELNVYNKARVNAYFQAHKWAIVTKEEALSIFRNAELEAKQFLVRPLFLKKKFILLTKTC